MVYRTVICVLLVAVAVVGMTLGCGQTTHQEEQEASAVMGSTFAPVPASTGNTQSPVSAGPPHYDGPTSIEERIVSSVAIVRARLTNTTTEVVSTTVDNWDQYYYPALKFHFSVSDYLYGNGANTITAYFITHAEITTTDQAEAWLPTLASQRDSRFDDRDAILFLTDGTKSQLFTALAEPQNAYVLSSGGTPLQDSGYWINDRHDRRWLPATETPATPSNSQKFLLEAPVEGSTPSTITLGDLKARIAAITTEISASGNAKQYQQCLQFKYLALRKEQWTKQKRPEYTMYKPDWDGLLASGQPAETQLYKQHGSTETLNGAEQKTALRLDGDDATLFSVEEINRRPFKDNVTLLDHSVVSARPIPAGTYRFNHNYRPTYLDCGNTYTFALTANVTAPAGTLHEAFYDPVAVGNTIVADSTNGVLEPATFTDAGGTSATLSSISYESSTVKVEVTPNDALVRHILDFIELDGTVSLSLDVADATVDASTDTLGWSLSSAPWEDGDKLMVRIREIPPTPLP